MPDVDLDHVSLHVSNVGANRTDGVKPQSPKRARLGVCADRTGMHRNAAQTQSCTRRCPYSRVLGHDLVMQNADGNPWNPSFQYKFSKLARTAGSRRFRFRDLWNAFAKLSLSSGTSIKGVQSVYGHNAASLPLSTYARVGGSLARCRSWPPEIVASELGGRETPLANG